jgi:hypothetical protein
LNVTQKAVGKWFGFNKEGLGRFGITDEAHFVREKVTLAGLGGVNKKTQP